MEITIVVALILLTIFNIYKIQQEQKEFKPMYLTLAPIGNYHRPVKNDHVNLKQYFVDQANNLYSCNLESWELNPPKGRDILKCSDKTVNSQGEIINTMRDIYGVKVTVSRPKLNFKSLKSLNGSKTVEVLPKSDRHFTVITSHVELNETA